MRAPLSPVLSQPRPEAAAFSSFRAGTYTRKKPYILLSDFAGVLVCIDEDPSLVYMNR